MAIVKQYDKRVNKTYLYESKSYRVKGEAHPRSKRTLLGILDSETGELIPTDGRGKKRGTSKSDTPLPNAMARKFYGATYLFDKIGEKLGIDSDLKACFPETHEQIKSVAYFCMLEDSSPLYRFEKWDILHKHPYGANIPSQRSSELFASITEDAKNSFFKRFTKRHEEKEHWYYDTTSISSCSENLKQVQYGVNKENDKLPHINLGIVYGRQSNLPFYYRKYPGNIPDVSTVDRLISDFEAFGFRDYKLVMDRGCYSEANINKLMKKHKKFLTGIKISLKIVTDELNKIYDDFRTVDNYSEQYKLYSTTVKTSWKYTDPNACKKDKITSNKRVYLHLYYNVEKAAEDEQAFINRLMEMRNELLSEQHNQKNKTAYDTYFTVTKTPKRGVKVQVKEEAVKAAKRYFGFFALFSNETMSSVEALETYRNKDLVEKTFYNVKERLNQRRTLVSSELSLNGKLFVVYIGLIYLSYLKKHMQTSGLFEKYTMTSLLDKLDVIEYYEYPDKRAKFGEITEKQRNIYRCLGVQPPL